MLACKWLAKVGIWRVTFSGKSKVLRHPFSTIQVVPKPEAVLEATGDLKKIVQPSFKAVTMWYGEILPQETFFLTSYISAEACQCMWNMFSAVQKIYLIYAFSTQV